MRLPNFFFVTLFPWTQPTVGYKYAQYLPLLVLRSTPFPLDFRPEVVNVRLSKAVYYCYLSVPHCNINTTTQAQGAERVKTYALAECC